MASVVGKRINGRTYYYLAESRRVGGKPRIVAQRYLGTAADIAAAVSAVLDGDAPGGGAPGGGASGGEAPGGRAPGRGGPDRTRHLAFGDVAAVWGVLTDLGLAELVDEVVGSRRTKVSTGTYVALGVLHQAVASGARFAFDGPGLDLAAWWRQSAAARFVRPRIDPDLLDRRRFWRAMSRITESHLEQLEAALFPRLVHALSEVGPPLSRQASDDPRVPVLAVDVPAFATYARTSTTGDRGRGNGGDSGDRLAGLGVVVTLDGAVPLVSDVYWHREDSRRDSPGDTFTALVRRLADRHRSLTAQRPDDWGDQGSDDSRDRGDAPTGKDGITVVVDAGQSSQPGAGSFAGLHVVASLPPGDHPELLAVPASRRRAVDPARFPGVTAYDTRIRVAGVDRRAVALHSRLLHDAQARGLAQDLASATRRLDELAAALRQGTQRLPRERVLAEIARITRFRWVDRVLSTTLTGTEPADLRLRWSVDESARARLAQEVFGRQLLVTDHDDWSVADVLTAYRARYRIEGTLRHWGGPVIGSPSTGWRWDDHRIAVHSYVRILATTVTHLMRQSAQREGLDLSVRELFDRLSGIEETELRYRSTGGRPRTRRILAERDADQERLFDLFGLARYAPDP
ncbi:transposase [Actinopolymorpha sp. B9G3]|uniref:IS1634 family transposase n=2 Tax=unclassified Actinopolymorpha TaxID=2627063 RepID=UPI0032D98BBF